MQKEDVIAFFDRWAPQWESESKRNDKVINTILDYAQVSEGKDLLDVACGTGVLIPDYLERNVGSVTAIDISPEMVKIAARKFQQKNVQVICGDVETYTFRHKFDVIVVYNAFPHFCDPEVLIRTLTSWLNPGGVLAIAHGMSRAAINRCHSGSASKVSKPLLSEDELAEIMEKDLQITVKRSDENMYIVAGCLGEMRS